ADNFLAEQLQPENIEAACVAVSHPLTVNRRDGYDHSYYFIASFIGEHIAYHARAVG
ncbi:MAG: S-formylglutathione hydrolase, partial [Myxococcota bacterium]